MMQLTERETLNMLQINKGFTLIELMVTISIVAILASIAIPSFTSITAKVRMKSEIDTIASDLNFARSEAAKRGLDVSVCPSGGCATTDWSGGWTIFQGTLSTPITTNIPIRSQYALASSDTLTSAGSLTGGVSFNRNGFTYADGQITLHDAANTASLKRCLKFTTIGNWALQTGTSCS